MADRNVKVTVSARVSDFNRGMAEARRAVRGLHDEIDKTNDRTAWLAQSILALTPAVTTLGAGAVPVISGLATQLVLAGGAAGTMALAFNGVGDSLGALNDYQLDPTAEKLEKLNEAMAKVGPEGEQFVRYLDSLGPAFSDLANTARGGIFPGVTEGIESFMTLMPRFQAVIGEIGEGIGSLGADMGAGLAGPEWRAFWAYLEDEAKPLLEEMGRTIGNFITGLANMMVAFGPLTSDFSAGFEEMSKSFADWSASLSGSTGFQEFVEYVREAGPLALDFLASVSMALVELVEAAAPVGTLMLPGLTALVDVVGALADTALGPLVLGFTALTSAWGRLNAVAAITGSGALARATGGIKANVSQISLLAPSLREVGNSMAFAAYSQDTLRKSMASGSQVASTTARNAMLARTQVTAFGKAAAPVAGQLALLGLAGSGVAASIGLSNTATLGLAGSLAGPWGAAVGAGAGLLLDFKASSDSAADALERFRDVAESSDLSILNASIAEAEERLGNGFESDGIKDFLSDIALTALDPDRYAALTTELEKMRARRDELTGAEARAADQKGIVRRYEVETEALQANIAAMREKREEALRAFSAETNYAQAILDATEAFKENGATLDLNTQAGLDNRRALEGIAAGFNALTDDQKNAKGAIRDAKDALYDQAIEFGATDKEARRYVRTLLEIPPKAETRILLETHPSLVALRHLREQIANVVNRDYFINLGVRAPNLSGLGPTPLAADGATVPNAPGPYRDQFLYGLAPLEEVVSNRRGQATKYRPVLKAINADMPPEVIKGMLADGGTVAARKYATPAVSSTAGIWPGEAIDYDRLTDAMLRARPLHGPTYIKGDPTEYKRMLQRDEQAANLGGRPRS